MTDEKSRTGTDLLRAAVAIRVKRIVYAGLAKDVGLAPDDLVAFAQGHKTLPAAVLCKLTGELFANTVYLEDLDLLAPVDRSPPRPLGVRPEPYQAKPLNLRPAIPG